MGTHIGFYPKGEKKLTLLEFFSHCVRTGDFFTEYADFYNRMGEHVAPDSPDLHRIVCEMDKTFELSDSNPSGCYGSERHPSGMDQDYFRSVLECAIWRAERMDCHATGCEGDIITEADIEDELERIGGWRDSVRKIFGTIPFPMGPGEAAPHPELSAEVSSAPPLTPAPEVQAEAATPEKGSSGDGDENAGESPVVPATTTPKVPERKPPIFTLDAAKVHCRACGSFTAYPWSDFIPRIHRARENLEKELDELYTSPMDPEVRSNEEVRLNDIYVELNLDLTKVHLNGCLICRGPGGEVWETLRVFKSDV